MARKKVREYDSKRILKEHLKRLAGIELGIKSAQVNEKTDFKKLADKEPWLSSTRLVVKPDMLFGKRGKSGLVALNLDLSGVESFVKERLGKEVDMSGTKGPITTFIVEPFVPHTDEYCLSIMSDCLGANVSFSECGGIDIEENWDKVKSVFVPTEQSLTTEVCAPLIATLPLEVRSKIEEFLKGVFTTFLDLDFTLLEMNPFTIVDGTPYPLDMRGELDDTALFKNFQKWGAVEFPLPFGRTMSAAEEKIHRMDEKRPFAEMRTGRKNLKRDALDRIPEPELGHVLMRVVGLRGSNVIEAKNSVGENTLCLLPAKFSKTIWVKTGSFIFVDEVDRERAIESGSKVTGTISRVLLDDQVRGLRKTSAWWPEYFDKAPERVVDKVEEQEDRNDQDEGGDIEKEDEESDDDGLPPLEANSNRSRSFTREDSTESDSDEEGTLNVGKN